MPVHCPSSGEYDLFHLMSEWIHCCSCYILFVSFHACSFVLVGLIIISGGADPGNREKDHSHHRRPKEDDVLVSAAVRGTTKGEQPYCWPCSIFTCPCGCWPCSLFTCPCGFLILEAWSLVCRTCWYCVEDPASQSLWSNVIASHWCWSWRQQVVQHWSCWPWSAAWSVS